LRGDIFADFILAGRFEFDVKVFRLEGHFAVSLTAATRTCSRVFYKHNRSLAHANTFRLTRRDCASNYLNSGAAVAPALSKSFGAPLCHHAFDIYRSSLRRDGTARLRDAIGRKFDIPIAPGP
jgi:hypothetical protein